MSTIIEFPEGKNSGRTYEVNINDYIIEINTVNDFKEKILEAFEYDTIGKCNELINEIDKMIDDRIPLKLLAKNKKDFLKRIKDVTDDNDYIKNKFKEQIDKANDLIFLKIKEGCNFIIDNADEIKKLIDEKRITEINRLKQNRMIVNKKYYENKKKLLQIPERQLLTEEQKKENRKLANKKYREKQKGSSNILQKEEKIIS